MTSADNELPDNVPARCVAASADLFDSDFRHDLR